MPHDLVFLHGSHQRDCVAIVDKRFDYHTLQLMTCGRVRLWYDTIRHDLEGAWLWPCFPGPRIAFHGHPQGRAWDHRHVAITGQRVASWREDRIWPYEPVPVDAAAVPVFAHRFDRLRVLANQPGRWQQLDAANLLERMLLEIAQLRASATSPGAVPGWLDPVIQTLATTGRRIDYEALAWSHGMSLSTLRRQFRAATGESLHQYRVKCRVVEARRLLGETDQPIKHIARDLGYQDVYYFTRQFTKMTDLTPAAYRRSRQVAAWSS